MKKIITDSFVEIVADSGKELFNGTDSADRVTFPLEVDFSTWVERLIPMPQINEEMTANEVKEVMIKQETNRYLQRTNDGQNAYAKISAEFRLAKLSGVITEETQKHIESVLIPVRNEVLAGQWISSLAVLETIGIEAVGQVLYDRLHLQISEYINSNY